ncbi:ribosomal protein S5 domain 2-type protein [Mycena albidolilacea]|uniref:Ribosomal protein S5 domain 2-type protein n=1 Tax=Mycena albidolilacea TaxID=1033008 RepID=A0AAD6ZU08_9AGAR|nr:ribosomal protein S5 domain 2-type protein [Mycena albidolilacea]
MGLAQPEAQDVKDFIADLMQRPDREPVGSEMEVLQSIYGDDAIQLWIPSANQHHDPGVTRYEAVLSLPSPHEDVSIRVLVSLPESYPATAPPQLQLLSRYVGAFGADASLFGAILRTFISSTSGVEWVPDAVCVFDGLQNVLDRCAVWYGDRLSADAAGAMVRADTHPEHQNQTAPPPSLPVSTPDPVVTELPQGIEIFVAEPINDRKSAFVGRACVISDPSEVPIILAHLVSDRRIARAAHPVINAWRCQVSGVLHQDNDDDGETAAGGRLAHLLHILEVDNVLVVVTRYFGGIHLGPDRFKHINQAARNALDLGGFLDTPAKGMVRGRHR